MGFEEPFAIHEWRRCRRCNVLVEVFLLNGATAPRDPYFTCADCLRTDEATDERVDTLVNREQRPQLGLIEGGANG